MYDFKNSFFLNFLLIHIATYIFSRDMFCLYYFRAKIHSVCNFSMLQFTHRRNFSPFFVVVHAKILFFHFPFLCSATTIMYKVQKNSIFHAFECLYSPEGIQLNSGIYTIQQSMYFLFSWVFFTVKIFSAPKPLIHKGFEFTVLSKYTYKQFPFHS